MRELSKQLRADRKRANPAKWTQQILPENEDIDPTLFFLGCGDDHQRGEKGESRRVNVCPNRLLIFAPDGLRSISVTHDLGVVPDGQPGTLVRSDELWLNGRNFETLRLGWQSIYRAPIDQIIVIENIAIRDIVKDGLDNRITIDNPEGFTAQGVWLDGRLTDDWTFPAGGQTLDAPRTLQFATATPKTIGPYPPTLENHSRLDVLAKALVKELSRRKKENPLSLFPLSIPLSADLATGKIKADSSANTLMRLGLQTLTSTAAWDIPENLFGNSLYLVDPNISPSGARGVIWGVDDPYISRAKYPPFFFEIPDWTTICATRPPSPESCGANFFSPNLEADYYFPLTQAFLAWAKTNSLYNLK